MTRRLLVLALLAASAAPASAQWAASEPALGAAAPPAGGGVLYAYDDGAASSNIGPPSTFDPDMLWGNYYETEPGGERLTEISVAFGPTFPSRAGGVTFWVLDDPDADGDPRNATAVASVTAVPDVSGNTPFRVALPPTRVSAAFFVGASARLLGGQDRPARLDTDARADRSWFFYAPDIAATIDSLAAAPFGTRMDDRAQVPFPGAFMVRAVGEAAAVAAEGRPPERGALGAPHPNPARGAVTVPVRLPAPARATVEVVDALGRVVQRGTPAALGAGAHRVRLDVGALPPGVYALRLDADGAAAATRRLTVAR